MNANSWLNDAHGLPRNIVRLNDFGGSIGGPILKNKLFFFGTYAESIRPATLMGGPSSAGNSIFSAGAQAGIFQFKAANGSTQSVNLLQIGASAGGPATINSNVAAQFQKINGVLSDGTLTPTSDPNISTLNWLYPGRQTVYYPALRFDYNATERLHLNVSYSQTKTLYPGM